MRPKLESLLSPIVVEGPSVWKMCAHFLKFVCIVVLLFACGGRPTVMTVGEWTGQIGNCNKSANHSHDWDYLQFVVQWPESVCRLFNQSNRSHHHHIHHHHRHQSRKCIIPLNIRHWTIHGTWPSMTGNMSPQCCNNSWTFNLDEISDLLPEMNQSWPNLFVGDALDTFWSHEWVRHGTCCADLPALYGEHNYFGKTMDFRQKFGIDKALSDAGIVPSSSATYKLADIRQAVQNATSVSPDLQCFALSTNTTTTLQCLAEIRMCLNKMLVPRDCPVSKSNHSSTSYLNGCSPDIEILLLPIS